MVMPPFSCRSDEINNMKESYTLLSGVSFSSNRGWGYLLKAGGLE